MHVKNIWLTSMGADLHSISIRLDGKEGISFDETELPPLHLVNGKRLNIDEAREAHCIEKVIILRGFTIKELLQLQLAIDEYV